MVKWVYTADGKPKALLQFPPISKLGKEILHYNNEEKAAIFIEYFFLLPVKADLNNILNFIYLKLQIVKEKVKKEDIIMALKGLAFNKALGLKKIIN